MKEKHSPRRDSSRVKTYSKELIKSTMTADTISRMFLQAFRNERSLFLMTGLLLLMYFFIMDIALYVNLQNTTLIDQQMPPTYSPFKPLSIKLLMTAPTNHYIISLTSEYFEEFTHFAKVFWFITPNMVSFLHLILGFVSAKFVTSEYLRQRRIGVVIFEVRMWLDVYDGIIYRVHKGEILYQSNRMSMGYFVDILCDTTAGTALCFGCLFYLWKTSQTRIVSTPDNLPWSKSEENGIIHVPPGEKVREKHSRKYIFFKLLCFGLMMALVGMTWDKTVEKSASLLQTKMETTIQKEIQTAALHSGSTWLMFYMWRVFEGQALLQMLLVAVFIDKLWEFLCAIQYLGYVILATINIYSLYHLHQIDMSLKI